MVMMMDGDLKPQRDKILVKYDTILYKNKVDEHNR